MVIAVGVVMGLHAAYEIFIGGVEISWDVIWTYLPVSLLYIGSMTLGYVGLRRSVSTAGRVSGTLLASSFRRSRVCFDAMESRGYDGKLAFLSHAPRLRPGHLLAATAYVLALLGLIFVRKGWLCP